MLARCLCRESTYGVPLDGVLVALDRIVVLVLAAVQQSVDVPADVALDVHGQTLLDQRVRVLLLLQAVVRQSLHRKSLCTAARTERRQDGERKEEERKE